MSHWNRTGNGWRVSTGAGDYYLDARPGREIAQWRPDLAVFSVYTMPAVQLAMWQAVWHGIPWVYWGEAVAAGGNSWHRRIVRNLALLPIRRAAGLFGVGQKAVQNFRNLFPSLASIHNVPYFSQLERFRPPDPVSRRHDAVTKFLYVGSFSHRKGVDTLAGAFSELVGELPDTQLIVAGDGDPGRWFDAHLTPGAAERVVRRGFVPWHKLPELYEQADFLVLPSRYDGWGMVVPEAMASGVPVIGSASAGAVQDLVEPGVTGWRIVPDSRDALRMAMKAAAKTSAETYGRMRTRCLARARRYDAGVGARLFTRAVSLVLADMRGDGGHQTNRRRFK